MEYTVNKQGTIFCNGSRVIMEDNHPTYIEYVKFLNEGGTVVQENKSHITEIINEVRDLKLEDRGIKSVKKMTSQNDAIEYLLTVIETLYDKVKEIETDLENSKGLTGTFTIQPGSKISVKNGIVTSIKNLK